MSVHLPLTACYYQPHMGSVMALRDELLNPLFSPFFRSVLFEPVKHGGNAILKKTTLMTEPRGSGRLYTNVESTRWGGDPLQTFALLFRLDSVKLHLTMQKEIPHDLLPHRYPPLLRSAVESKLLLWTVDPTELLISLAGKWMVCLTSDEVVPLKLKDDPGKLLFSTAEGHMR